MEIRPIQTQDDRAAISRIYEESWKHAYRGILPQAYLDSIPTGNWCNSLDAPGRNTLLLLDGSEIVGTASYSASRFEQMYEYGEIVSIYILPEYCAKGYGKALLQAAINGLREIGFRDIFLWVLEENRIARRFYEKFGFQANGGYTEVTLGGKTLREVQYTYHIP